MRHKIEIACSFLHRCVNVSRQYQVQSSLVQCGFWGRDLGVLGKIALGRLLMEREVCVNADAYRHTPSLTMYKFLDINPLALELDI